MPQNRDPALYCIYRAEKGTTSPAWRVVVKRRKERFDRTFCDSTHGDKAAALRAAKRWRDRIVATHPPMAKNEYNSLLRASNTSGIVGVRFHCTQSDAYWAAETCLPDGRKLRKFFNTRTFGHHRAKELAIAERTRQLAEVRGVFVGSAPQVVVTRLSRRAGKE
jgi:hypothetical protein